MKKKITFWGVCILSLLGVLASCSDDKYVMPQMYKNNNMSVGETRAVTFGGNIGIDNNGSRGFEIEGDSQHPDGIRVKWSGQKGRKIKVRFALANARHYDNKIDKVICFDVEAPLQYRNGDESKPYISIKKRNIYLPAEFYASRTNKWYISGVIGGISNSGNSVRFAAPYDIYKTTYIRDSQDPSIIVDETEAVFKKDRLPSIDTSTSDPNSPITYRIPFACKWTQVNRNVAGNFFDFNLVFMPQGSIIGYRVKSLLYDDCQLKGFSVATDTYASDVSFNFDKAAGQTDSDVLGTYPDYDINDNKLPSEGNLFYRFHFVDNLDIPGYRTTGREESFSKYFYTWGIRVKEQNSGVIRLRAVVIKKDIPNEIKEFYDMDNNTNAKFNVLQLPKTPESVIIRKNGRVWIEDGKVVLGTMELGGSADLLMTEFLQVPIPKEDQGKDNVDNYSILEIYNPTSRTIDLSRYALVKTYFPEANYGAWNSRKSLFYFSANDFYSSAYNPMFFGVAQALCVPDTDPFTFENPVRQANYEEDYLFSNRTKYLYGTNINRKRLAPGKCALIMASAYMKDGVKPYGGKIKAVSNRYADEIQKNVNNGNCTLVIAVDNGHNKNFGPVGLGGTFQMGVGQGLMLLRNRWYTAWGKDYEERKRGDIWNYPQQPTNGIGLPRFIVDSFGFGYNDWKYLDTSLSSSLPLYDGKFDLYNAKSEEIVSTNKAGFWVRNARTILPTMEFVKTSSWVEGYDTDGTLKSFSFDKRFSDWYVTQDINDSGVSPGRR